MTDDQGPPPITLRNVLRTIWVNLPAILVFTGSVGFALTLLGIPYDVTYRSPFVRTVEYVGVRTAAFLFAIAPLWTLYWEYTGFYDEMEIQ